MPREDLTLWLNTSPQDFAPSTTPQLNTPSSFNSGSIFEQISSQGGLIAVGVLGLEGKKVFDKVTGGIGQYTGRNDWQRKINRGKKAFGYVSQVAIGFAVNPLVVGATLAKIGIDAGIDIVEFNIQRDIDVKEASFRREIRGHRINESRSR